MCLYLSVQYCVRMARAAIFIILQCSLSISNSKFKSILCVSFSQEVYVLASIFKFLILRIIDHRAQTIKFLVLYSSLGNHTHTVTPLFSFTNSSVQFLNSSCISFLKLQLSFFSQHFPSPISPNFHAYFRASPFSCIY